MIHCAASQHSSIQFCHRFIVTRSSASLLFFALERDTSLSLSCNWFSCKLIWFRRSADYLCALYLILTNTQVHKHTNTHTHVHANRERWSVSFSHTHTHAYTYCIHTFTRARLDCCHGSLPNEGWDDSWNSDIIMHHTVEVPGNCSISREKNPL